MSVVEAVLKEIEWLGPRAEGSPMAATALSLAEGLDDENSLTSKGIAAKALIDVMRELRALVPAKAEDDEIERARKRRVARQSAAGASPSS